MNDIEKKWLAAWRRAGPELERIRRDEIRHADTLGAIESLTDAFRIAQRDLGARMESGLVEQQRWFAKWSGS